MEKDVNKPVICKICKRKFSRKYTLNRHHTRFHSGQSLTYHCNICKKDFDILSDFEDHKILVHKPSKDFKRYNTSLQGSLEIYRKILPLKETTFDEGFDKTTVQQVKDLINYKLLYHPSYLIHFIFCAEFKLFNYTLNDDNNIIDLDSYSFKSPSGTVFYQNNRANKDCVNKLRNYLSNNIDDFMRNGSGFVLHDVLYLDVQFVKKRPL